MEDYFGKLPLTRRILLQFYKHVTHELGSPKIAKEVARIHCETSSRLLEIGMNDANEGGRVIRLRLINLLEPTTSSKNKNMNMPVTVNVTNVMKNIFTIKKWQERTLTGSMKISYAKSTRLHWDNNEKIFNNYKYDPSISNHKEDWSTGNVVVSIKPLDIVTLHLVT